jgi:glycine/D-amino acid oxidase-like deaminating enzyme
MTPTIKPISSDESLPASTDVVIIGAGIVGVTAAYFLARRGLSVALIEKGCVSGEQSSRNWGWCRQQNRDIRELPMAGLALRLWDELSLEMGLDIGFRRCGLLYATDNPTQLEEWDSWREVARQFDIRTKMLTAEEATALIPSGGRKWLGGVHSLEDGKGEPWLAAPSIALGVRRLGGTIHQGCAVRGLDVTNGEVTGVMTERGLVRTNSVLCAAGVWSSAFCRQHGVTFPLSTVCQTALRTTPAENIGEAIYTPDCALTRRLDGSYTVAISGKGTIEITPQAIRFSQSFMPMFLKRWKNVNFRVGSSFFNGPESMRTWKVNDITPMEQMRILDPEPNPQAISAMIQRITSQFPALANVEVSETWAGYIDCTPDAVPVISAVDEIRGFYLAAGCSGHGFGLGPAIGHLAADLVANDTACVDPKPFRLSRLTDGSKVDVGAI